MKTRVKEFEKIMSSTQWSDKMYAFLRVIFHLYPEQKFHDLIHKALSEVQSDQGVYNYVQERLSSIKPFLSELTYALPALKTQKKEMAGQTLQILKDRRQVDGYLEIGSTGRYISALNKHLTFTGEIHLMNDRAPDNSPAEIMERGRIKQYGKFHQLDYSPIKAINKNSIELITCFIGLHHCPEDKLEAFISSLHSILKPGGLLLLRDHNVEDSMMDTFASLVHTVFNLGLKETWAFNQEEYRSFRSIEEWSGIVCKAGFKDLGFRILQNEDPSLNTLIALQKV